MISQIQRVFFDRSVRVSLAPRFVLFAPPTVILIRRLYERFYDTAFDMGSFDPSFQPMRIDTFQLLAWGVAFYLLAQLRPTRAFSRTDIAVAIVILLVGSLNSATGLGALTLFLFVMGVGDVRWRAVATVFGALFAQQAIVPSLYAVIAPMLIHLDAIFVGSAVKLTITGAFWQGDIIAIPSGHAIEILPACCSFHNVSRAVLCWVALTKLERPEWRSLDIAVLAAAASFQILFNEVRIYLMALSPEMYEYWHSYDYFGGTHIFTTCASVAAVLISTYGARLVSSRGISGRLAESQT